MATQGIRAVVRNSKYVAERMVLISGARGISAAGEGRTSVDGVQDTLFWKYECRFRHAGL